ncbi:MAG: HlyD family secretion protein [Methylacidiphilales bacterium]|nr:HlyD family secretion protein [Candidatus Methylacidiphilales bacterium]
MPEENPTPPAPEKPVESPPAKAEAALNPEPTAPSTRRRLPRPVLFVVGAIVLIMVVVWIIRSFHTVSTDDAYVNSYVTFVAPRVTGQVSQVLVEDNNRVKKGDVLVQLDPEPYQVALGIKQAALDKAQADYVVAEANTRSLLAQARSQRFKLENAVENVDNLKAVVRQRVAAWKQANATLTLAQQEYDRYKGLVGQNAVSTQDVEVKRDALDVAKAQVTQALENVRQARAALGLPQEPPNGKTLDDMPEDLDQVYSSVREALAELIQSGAQLGIVQPSYDLTPKKLVEDFYKRDPSGNIDVIYAEIIKNAPTLKEAQAVVERAQADVDQAKLDLRYCTIVAEIDGVVTRRNVNPGNYVQVGQSLMAVRSLKDIWVDANFKETQLRQLRIGQHVDLWTDMYGKHLKFEGRISGLTMGTGSTLALLPAQNATGNFVKVVQRLPVRIDLVNYDPDNGPLFVGLSVEPEVDIVSEPTGPNAGKFLQDYLTNLPLAQP